MIECLSQLHMTRVVVGVVLAGWVVMTGHGEKLAVVLCSVNLCRHALPASTGRAADQCTQQLLCLCWLEERAYKDSHYTAPPPTFHRVYRMV